MLQGLVVATCVAIGPALNGVGARFFLATLNIDDPCVASELSLPTVSVFKNGYESAARELDISGEFSARITDTVGVSAGFHVGSPSSASRSDGHRL